MIERNAMRCYLAIEAYLSALKGAAKDRVEARLRAWFTAVARYPRQLLDIEEKEYLRVKRADFRRYFAQ